MLEEPHIPFEYEVLYEDENIIVIDKPHFLATTPRGMWYRETALVRLCERYDEPNITPAHRLDRLTAGVVVFVRNPSARGAYQMLFQNRKTVKTYECLAPLAPTQRPRYGTAVRIDRHLPFPLVRRSHINKDRGRLQAYESADVPNAETLIERGSGIRFVAGRPYVNYTLHPKTGKTHQLRVHMNSLGLAILGDDFYPDIVQRAYDDFSQPLELVARELRFDDPLNGERTCRWARAYRNPRFWTFPYLARHARLSWRSVDLPERFRHHESKREPWVKSRKPSAASPTSTTAHR